MGGGGSISQMIHSNNSNRNLQTARNSYREKLVELNKELKSKEGELKMEKYPEISEAKKLEIKERVRREIKRKVLYSYLNSFVLLLIIVLVIYIILKLYG